MPIAFAAPIGLLPLQTDLMSSTDGVVRAALTFLRMEASLEVVAAACVERAVCEVPPKGDRAPGLNLSIHSSRARSPPGAPLALLS